MSAQFRQIGDLGDELLNPYRDIRNKNWIRQSGIFIAEGPLLVERLLQSSHRCHSLLVEHRYAEQFSKLTPPDVPILVAEHAIVEQLVGFNFHRGVLACGYRKPTVSLPLQAEIHLNETWLGLFAVNDPENVGGMLRTAAGLGIRRVLIGPGTADPYSRRALRVSMGNSLFLEITHVTQVEQTMLGLKSLGVELVATSLSPDSISLKEASRFGPVLLLMGNERHGLSRELIELSDRSVRIDMCLGTDSLNVCVAAGITMHHFCRMASSFR